MDTPEANRSHYDTLGDQRHVALHAPHISRRVGQAILDVYDFDPDATTVLDYACGSGAVAEIIASECKSILGVDISQGMVDNFNTKVANQGIESDEMNAVCTELKGELGELGGRRFDVVIAYHHFPDIEATTKILSRFLKDGSGVLIVVDLLRSADSLHLRHATSTRYGENIVAHRGGFSREEIEGAFISAGLTDFEFEIAFEKVDGGRKLSMFIAVGSREDEAEVDDK